MAVHSSGHEVDYPAPPADGAARWTWILFLPLAYLIGPVAGLGLIGVWIWQAATRGVQAWVLVTMWRGRKWQTAG